MFQIVWNSSRILRNYSRITKRLYSKKLEQHLASFPERYDQKEVEKFWSGVWVDEGLFKQTKQIENDPKTFRMLLPPPNITGKLHLGHSLTVALQDAICRYQRMNGRPVIWYGGMDHAGIATQMLVEKMIRSKYQKSRHDLSKEEFDNFLKEWKHDKATNIQQQLEALGASIDFDKFYFTLSPELQDFVQDSFIELFNRGFIYRASYMVNWSYYLQSTLSDIEVDHKFISRPTMMTVPGCDEPFEVGVMHRFRYPIVDHLNPEFSEYLTVATTRIESIVGDVALAVNPEDGRYASFIGREAYNPFTRQRMPIVSEPDVKMDFGTGVLKLTPAHSQIDSEIAMKHHLPTDLVIFDDRGLIDCEYTAFNGVHRYAAKKLVVEELTKLGLYEGSELHPHWLPLCSRSGDIIESKQVPQWFLNAEDGRYATEFVVNRDNLSEESQKKWHDMQLKQRNISLIPSGYRNTWRDWFSRYKDWCISRQITWGHRIPAYEIVNTSGRSIGWIAAKSEEQAKKLALEKFSSLNEGTSFTVKQDKDVLDTWFSSALLPIAISKDHPLDLMETGNDIIFFWVARMVLMSLLLRNRLPFERVLLHGMICDAQGKKMSKSKGNVIDPMHLIDGVTMDRMLSTLQDQFDSGAISEDIFVSKTEEYFRTLPKGIPICGADILRLSLLQSDFKEHKIKFDLQKTLNRRPFANKMFQTVRFFMLHLDEIKSDADLKLPEAKDLTKMERWILGRLADLIQETRQSFESYELHKAAVKIERFWINDLCDVFLEHVKNEKKSFAVLNEVIQTSLRVIHPFMPFITEHLYQHITYKLPNKKESFQSIVSTPFPDVESSELLKLLDSSLDRDYQDVFEIISKIRWFKQYFFVHRDPLVKKILILSNNPRMAEYSKDIQASSRIMDCEFGFLSLHDLYQLDDISKNWYCFQVKSQNSSEPDLSNKDVPEEESNSTYLEADEIYIAFQMERQELNQKLEQPKLGLKREKIDNLLQTFDDSHCRNFTKNFKKLTKIVV